MKDMNGIAKTIWMIFSWMITATFFAFIAFAIWLIW